MKEKQKAFGGYLYKPSYKRDKKDKEIIDRFIKLEGEGFVGKNFTTNSDLVQWRVKSKAEKLKLDQNDLYEVNQIVKRYNYDMKQRMSGYNHHYISTFSELLYKKRGKAYLHQRKIQITEASKKFKRRNALDKTIKQDTFYLTASNDKFKMLTKQRNNTRVFHTLKVSQTLDEKEEEVELDVSLEMKTANEELRDRQGFIGKLKEEYNFYRPIEGIRNTYDKKMKKLKSIVFGSSYDVNINKILNPSQNEFFKTLNRRMKSEISYSDQKSRKMLPRIKIKMNI